MSYRESVRVRIAVLLLAGFGLGPKVGEAQVYGPVTKNLGDGARATATVYDEGGEFRLVLSGDHNGSCRMERNIWVSGNEQLTYRHECDVGGAIGDVVVDGSVQIYGYQSEGSRVTFSVLLSGVAWDDTVFGRGATLGSVNDGWTNIHLVKQPRATFDRVWMEHNVQRGEQAGMFVRAEMVVSNLLHQQAEVVAFFFYEGTDQRIRTIHGQNAQVSERVESPYESTRWDEFGLFFPYADFALPNGRTDMEVLFQVFGPGGQFIGQSERRSFYMNR